MQNGARLTTVSFSEITPENQVQLQFMPKAQQMNIQYILSILKNKKNKKILEWQMQLKHPEGMKNLTVNL